MLDARHVAEHLDEVRAALARRSAQAAETLGDVAEISARRRELIARTEALQAERNRASQELAKLAKSDPAAIEARRGELRKLGDEIKLLDVRLTASETELEERLLGVPNTPHPSSPDGSGAEDNPVRAVWGAAPSFAFAPKPHWELGSALGVIDFERASKLSGPRFAVLWGPAARLERALITFMLDLHTREHGYTEVYPPFLVKADALRGTGQLPKFENDLFKTQRQGPDEDRSPLYLIPTAEVPVTNLHADEILDAASLPLAYAAYTPCFRSEAGSYGKDVRGLIRQHQFDKVELVRFCEPSQSLEQLELLTSHAEAVLQRLGLHYRKVELCAGDLGFSASKTYDLEVWLPSQNQFREISSCSSFGDYQARRAKIRYKPGQKAKPRIAHTLNGSGLAVGRTLIAIFEQYQQADGSVVVPEPLRAFMGIERISAGA
jgi:seryl-tRNA synthetase